MINHIRTLLMNTPGNEAADAAFPGEEIVDPNYMPIVVPNDLQTIRNVLFDINPDRAMLNYRLRQYLTIIHTTEFDSYLTALDPRITYWPVNDSTMFHASSFGPTAVQVNTPLKTLSFLNTFPPLKNASTLLQKWKLTVTDGSNLTIDNLTAPVKTTIVPYTLSSGVSNVIQLPNSPISIRFENGVGSIWFIQMLYRPLFELLDIITSLMKLDVVSNLSLFNGGSVEPYKTFANLWSNNEELLYRITGIILALAYRMHDILNGS